jgi:hypothetical protein
MQIGFQTLRDFVTQRPTLRGEAMTILLELTTHTGAGISDLRHRERTDQAVPFS